MKKIVLLGICCMFCFQTTTTAFSINLNPVKAIEKLDDKWDAEEKRFRDRRNAEIQRARDRAEAKAKAEVKKKCRAELTRLEQKKSTAYDKYRRRISEKAGASEVNELKKIFIQCQEDVKRFSKNCN